MMADPLNSGSSATNITTKNTTNDDNSEENNEPIVIHPDDNDLNSDSDNELEFCDALENNEKPGVRDELSDIKSKKVDHENRKINDDSDPFHEGDDEYRDAENDENSEHELNDAELRDRKGEELQRRKEAEDRLSEETKQERRQDALNIKKSANDLYVSSQHREAIAKYTEALDLCPLCFPEDRAILLSNRAAAKIKLEEKDSAIEDCSEAIELNDKYLKAILRRAQLYEYTDKPHEALRDFEKVLELDPKHIESLVAVRRLPDKIKEKDEKLKAEMMDNLKKLGNMCLKPFGLSTENFQFVQDPNSGG